MEIRININDESIERVRAGVSKVTDSTGRLYNDAKRTMGSALEKLGYKPSKSDKPFMKITFVRTKTEA